MGDKCVICGSYAVNPGHHGRPDFSENVDHDLCDVCYWRARYEEAEEKLARCQDRKKEAAARDRLVRVLTEDEHNDEAIESAARDLVSVRDNAFRRRDPDSYNEMKAMGMLT